MDSLSSPSSRQLGRGFRPEYSAGLNGGGGSGGETRQQLTKVLLNVNIQNTLGTVHVVMPPESTVAELMKAAIGVYVKEKRRPLLRSVDPRCYELHYSQFSLESLKTEEKLIDLGSRNFFLCTKSAGYA